MSLDRQRAFGSVAVDINRERCHACGTCARVCPEGVLAVQDGRLAIEAGQGLGCVACGHCACICPYGALRVSGRDLSPSDVVPLEGEAAGYRQLQRLLLGRRSIRRFRKEPVAQEDLDRILDAAATAPMGFPPSHVGVLIANGREQVQALRGDLLVGVRGMRRFLGGLGPLLGVMMGREAAEGARRFILPVAKAYEECDARGEDIFFYGAPLAIHFYGRALADPADPVIAATLAMTAAHALGLGTCVLGFPGPVLQHNRKLREKYGLPERIHPGMCLAIGHPVFKFRRAVRRRFVDVRTVA